MIERTFAMVKPDAVAAGHLGHVLTRVEQEGFRVAELKLKTFTPGEVDAFYAEHVERDFYPAMREFMVSGPVALMVLEREDAVAHWRAVIGPTDPQKAVRLHQEQTEAWREEYGGAVDEYIRIGGDAPPEPPKATLRVFHGDMREGAPMFRNAVHGSDSPASAAREIDLIFGRERLPSDVQAAFRRVAFAGTLPFSTSAWEEAMGALFDALDRHAIIDWAGGLAEVRRPGWYLANVTFQAVDAEVVRGRAKFPGNRHMLAALVEEVGEVAERLACGDREGAAREAIQVACVAVRIAEEGDATSYPLDGFVELVHTLGEVARHSLQRNPLRWASNLLRLSAAARRIEVSGDPTFSDVTDAEAQP